MKMKFFIVAALFITFASCKSYNSKTFQVLISDTSKTHMAYNEVYISKQNAHLLNLPEIQNGVDSFEMRIWYWGFIGGTRLIDLRYIKDKWVCNNTNYVETWEYPNATLDSSNTKAVTIPKEIDSIVKYLTSDSILRLPSQEAIPNFRDRMGDGQDCFIEISTSKFYKALRYHCPEHYSDKYNQMFLRAVLFLDRYFNFYSPWCT